MTMLMKTGTFDASYCLKEHIMDYVVKNMLLRHCLQINVVTSFFVVTS